MKNRFWKDKKVLITGYEGFLGSHLTKCLISRGVNVIGLDIKVRRNNTILTEDDYKRIIVIKGGVTNSKLVGKIISDYKIEVVFHLAAEAIVEECHKNPGRAFKSNIEGTWSVLEASRNIKTVKAIICASSDKAYGNCKTLPYKEDTPLRGAHPYDVSKGCADLISYTYWNAYKVPVAVTRCGNIYGPGDFNFSRIIPDAIRCTLSGDTLLIRSDGKSTRDYVYVGDIINGYIMLAEQLQKRKLFGEAFNFSDENPISVFELMKKINEISNKKLNFKILNEARYEIKHQYLASNKARQILGWKPSICLEKGLGNTINWYANYFKTKY